MGPFQLLQSFEKNCYLSLTGNFGEGDFQCMALVKHLTMVENIMGTRTT